MTLMTAQPIAITGTSPTSATPAASDTITPDTGLVLHVKNTNGASRTATIVVPGTSFGQNNPDVVVTIPATTGDVEIYLTNPNLLADSATGLITVTYSATTGVTSALKKVGG